MSATPARLVIDLAALQANYYRLCVEAGTAEVAGVVKADGYGLGAAPVGQALWQAGCRSFFVARLEEGIALRAALASVRIYVLEGLVACDADAYLAHDLIPVLNHAGDLELAARLGAGAGRRLPAALHVDTGMARLGFEMRDWLALDDAALAAIEPVLVMSHLACADEPDHELNALQLERFVRAHARLPEAPASLANSSGIFLGKPFHFGLARPGVALYGVNPVPGRTNPMTSVVTLEAPVLQVRQLDEPSTVGYGATCRVAAGSRLATVGTGYADGFLRAAGNGALARVAGIDVPLAGRVSMDLITLDVSQVPEDRLRPGMYAELIFGPSGIDDIAAAAGTIGYEVLTRLGRRFERVYREGDGS